MLKLRSVRVKDVAVPCQTLCVPTWSHGLVCDFSQVRVHTGSDAIHMNRDVGAQAFPHGSDIYFGEGHCPSNLELTAHELTHVVQQTGGAALTQGYRKYKATFQASPPFGASQHPASDHPAPRGATP